MGPYPAITLKEARRLSEAARRQVLQGIDPALEKREAKAAAKLGAENRFEAIAEEFISKRDQEGLADATSVKARWFLALLKPSIGKRPIADIKPPELLAALRRIEKAGHRESARRTRSFATRVLRHAAADGRAETDLAQPLRGALVAPIARHYAAITDRTKLGELLRAIDGYSGEPATMVALRLTPMSFSGQVRFDKCNGPN